MPDFIEPQLCRTATIPPQGPAWVHEIKFDGYRIQLRMKDGKARLLTRKGLDWTAKFPAIAAAASRLPDVIIDGEVVALNQSGRTRFSRCCKRRWPKVKTDDLIYFAFDLMFAEGEDLRELPLARSQGAPAADARGAGR